MNRKPIVRGTLAVTRDPVIFILAAGAVWASVMAAGGAMAMAPIAGWLWLTVGLVIRRAATRPTPAGHRTDRSPTAP